MFSRFLNQRKVSVQVVWQVDDLSGNADLDKLAAVVYRYSSVCSYLVHGIEFFCVGFETN